MCGPEVVHVFLRQELFNSLGLAAASLAAYALVLMDIDMPDERDSSEPRDLVAGFGNPVIILALTSYTSDDLPRIDPDLRFDGYLNKPLRKGKLLACVKPILK
ncbi:MAG: hypothetical protein A2527_07980 [Candidatus Lambdaproteobacteria bacterium RIFOXYD2_FULL_50_16]|uniref:Response regulatory domain-containing protein n=1 Tax=Candidatus Lambdaproteobacteria bacterium RIFOXYD2_FULL_50_16 TaxID=1817772 RepID=A0A1F6GAG9_9PROT|nr:MAG: hypothetical protein A2527_07980 [Candidatus Lambdaproteobacteria bacterium RIFOXYD2_FULL_50_16]